MKGNLGAAMHNNGAGAGFAVTLPGAHRVAMDRDNAVQFGDS